jgi:hypothetical protein
LDLLVCSEATVALFVKANAPEYRRSTPYADVKSLCEQTAIPANGY